MPQLAKMLVRALVHLLVHLLVQPLELVQEQVLQMVLVLELLLVLVLVQELELQPPVTQRAPLPVPVLVPQLALERRRRQVSPGASVGRWGRRPFVLLQLQLRPHQVEVVWEVVLVWLQPLAEAAFRQDRS